MSAEWQGLAQEKVYLAQCLLKHSAGTGDPGQRAESADRGLEAGLIQGAGALLLQARDALLVLVAQLNQSKVNDIRSLAALAEVLGSDNPDVIRLTELSRAKGSWVFRLDELQRWLGQPRDAPQYPVDDNVIAVSAASEGPDISLKSLFQLADEIRHYLAELSQWHGEW